MAALRSVNAVTSAITPRWGALSMVICFEVSTLKKYRFCLNKSRDGKAKRLVLNEDGDFIHFKAENSRDDPN